MKPDGTMTVTYEYDAWGNLISSSRNGSDAYGLYTLNAYTYRGYIYDIDTGFYYLQSRYYDPEVGRFLNADTAVTLLLECESVIQYNLFNYCWNNTVNMFDNEGDWPTATYEKSSNYMSLVITVPWKDIEKYFNARSYTEAVIGLIACFIPEPTISKAIGIVAGIDSIASGIISDVIANKKSGKSIRIGLSFNYKINIYKKYVYIVNTKWLKVGYWLEWTSPAISNIRWWVKT